MKYEFEAIRDQIDWWGKVAEAIGTTKGRPLTPFEHEDAAKCVFTAAERWLARDLQDFRIEGIEEEIFIEGIPEQRKPFHGFIDLRGTLTGEAKPYERFSGKTIICDWKTTDGNLDTKWRERQRKSWQWKLYAAAKGAAVFSYRGISRSLDTTELILEVPESAGFEAREYLTAIFSYRNTLVDSGLEVWPRSRPGACGAYGRTCPFDEECEEYSMPRAAGQDRQLSYSSISDLMLCPEKHRRKSLAPDEREETDSTIFGQAVHRGLEAVYEQAREIQNGL